jgi:hypothetical protein
VYDEQGTKVYEIDCVAEDEWILERAEQAGR